MFELKAWASDDRTAATIAIFEDDKQIAWIRVETTEFDDIIEGLEKVRRSLQPEVSPTLDVGARREAIVSPSWRIPEPDPKSGIGKLVCLRHPGLGWLSFVIPWEHAEEMARWLPRREPQTR